LIDFDKNFEKSEFFQSVFENYLQNFRNKLEKTLFDCEKGMFCLYEENELKTIYLILYLKRPSFEERTFFERFLYQNEKIIRIPISPEVISPVPFNTFFTLHQMANIEELHDILVKKNKIHDAIDLLKKIKYIKDIRKTEDGIQIFLAGYDGPIPLSSMGSGFISLLVFTFNRFLLDEGVLLLEEPEISLHPGYIDLMTEGIIENSNKTQFFITTHSQDVISSILRIGEKKNKLEEINFVLLHKIEDTAELFTEVIDGINAKNEVDKIKTDLRGA